MTKNKNEYLSKIVSCLKNTKFQEAYLDIAFLGDKLRLDLEDVELSSIEDINSKIITDHPGEKTSEANIYFGLFVNSKNHNIKLLEEAARLSDIYKPICWAAKTFFKGEEWSYSLLDKVSKFFNDDTQRFLDNLDISSEDFLDFPSLTEALSDVKKAQIYQTFLEAKPSDEKLDADIGWYNEYLQISYEEAEEIGDFSGGKLYGHIDDSFLDDPRWSQALSKGFATSAKGKNGIKFIENKLLELKINDGMRLSTTKVYKNSKGDFLATFEDLKNHRKIKNGVKLTKDLNVIGVSDSELSDYSDTDVMGDTAGYQSVLNLD